MRELVTEFQLPWPVSTEGQELVRRWSEALLSSQRFRHKGHGEDFFTDRDLNEVYARDRIIITRWIDPPETSFYCITGWELFEIFPWWRSMQGYFEAVGLTSWLPFPCILISRSRLYRHADIGRPTALNYPIFGADTMCGYFWENKEIPDASYIERYSYTPGKTLLLNTTQVHGGLPSDGHHERELRAIFNMGFSDDFETCKKVIAAATPKQIFGGFHDSVRA